MKTLIAVCCGAAVAAGAVLAVPALRSVRATPPSLEYGAVSSAPPSWEPPYPLPSLPDRVHYRTPDGAIGTQATFYTDRHNDIGDLPIEQQRERMGSPY